MKANLPVQITANFERNLISIEQFLTDADMVGQFDDLLEELSENLIPNLEQFPAIGRLFMSEPAQSIESRTARQKLQSRIKNATVHEYLMKNYLVLYARYTDAVCLLSIKHHRQLTFVIA